MNIAEMTLEEIRQHGIDALARELGPVGMIRFLQQFETGKGDYTAERHQWLPNDVEAIAEAMREKKNAT
jgi:hypothetical protein